MWNSRINMRNSIFKRLFMTFLIIMIPIYFITISIYKWGIQTVRTDISNAMVSQGSVFLGNLEMDIKHIKELQYDCTNDDNLNKLVYKSSIMTQYEITQAILAVQSRLLAVKNSSRLIRDVSVHIPAISRTISAYSSVSDLNEAKFEYFGAVPLKSDFQLVQWKDGIYIIVAATSTDHKGLSKPSFIIDVSFSENEFKKTLIEYNTYDKSGSVLVDRNRTFFTSSGNNEGIEQKLKNIDQISFPKGGNGTYNLTFEGEKYLAIYTSSDYLNMALVKYIPEKVMFKTADKYQIWMWILTAVSLLIIFLYSLSTYKFILEPLQKLVESFRRTESGDLNFRIEHKYHDEFGYLYQHFNLMTAKYDQLINQIYAQKILTQKAEFKHLQAQINPHFLYNSFFILQRMILGEDIEKAAAFSEQLGNYFRYITRSGAEEVPLYKEVEHARIYADIQAMRFSKRISVVFEELPEEYREIKVPRLILQPVLENTFEHGLKEKEADGILVVTFRKFGEGLYILIEDNGDALNAEQIEALQKKLENAENEAESTGILNIHRRIKLKFGEPWGLHVSRGELGGLKVAVRLPDGNTSLSPCTG